MRVLSQRPAVLAVALVAAFPSLAFAQPLAKALDRIVVTGSRTPQTQDAALASITVLDRADIERLQAQSLLSLLRGVPGLAFSNSGGPGKVDALPVVLISRLFELSALVISPAVHRLIT